MIAFFKIYFGIFCCFGCSLLQEGALAPEQPELEPAQFLERAARLLLDGGNDNERLHSLLLEAWLKNDEPQLALDFVRKIDNDHFRKTAASFVFRHLFDELVERSKTSGGSSNELFEDKEFISAAQLDFLMDVYGEGYLNESLRDLKLIRQLLKDHRFAVVERLITAIDADMATYKFQEGNFNSEYFTTHIVARWICQLHCDGGENIETESNKLLKPFGLQQTRDHCRLIAISNCLYLLRDSKENIRSSATPPESNVAAAEQILSELESSEKRMLGAFRIASHHILNRDLKLASSYTEILEANYDTSDSRFKRYFSEYLLGLAQLKLENGIDASTEIERIPTLGKRTKLWRVHVVSLSALYPDAMDWSKQISALGNKTLPTIDQSIDQLLDLGNRAYVNNSPLAPVVFQLRIEAATKLARKMKSPLLLAWQLRKVAEVYAGAWTGRVPRNGNMIFDGDVRKGRKLIDEALSLVVSDEAGATDYKSIDRTTVLASIAVAYAKLGHPAQALETAMRIPKDAEGTYEDVVTGDSSSKRSETLGELFSWLHFFSKRPFLENDGREVMDFLTRIADEELGKNELPVSDLLDTFLVIDREDLALEAFGILQTRLQNPQRISYSVLRALVKSQDVGRIQEWYLQCDESIRKQTTTDFCYRYWEADLLPNRDIADFLEREIDRHDLQMPRHTKACLLAIAWANQDRIRAAELMEIESDDSDSDSAEPGDSEKRLVKIEKEHQYFLGAALTLAINNNLPGLTMELIPRIKDSEAAANAAFRLGWNLAADPLKNDEPSDAEARLIEQPEIVRAAFLIGVARQRLGLPLR